MPDKIAIQGFQGSYHEMAARQYFGQEPSLVPCATFDALVARVLDGTADVGLMAMENSLVGSIMPNYALLEKAALRICGEVYLPIQQQLLALPGATLGDIKAVHSHPMALRQCYGFLGRHPQWQLVETEDTGHSAELLAQAQTPEIAVVAGTQAARMFGLSVLVPDINDEPNNYTRFLVVERTYPVHEVPDANKASLYFHTPHTPGGLAVVLSHMAGYGLNLTKLQSCPRPRQPWHYGFHVDLEFDDPAQFKAMLNELPNLTKFLRVLGIYRRGNRHEEAEMIPALLENA